MIRFFVSQTINKRDMIKSNHKVLLAIDGSADDAWKIIGGASGVEQWLAPITSCRTEGNKRICGTEDGEFEENILEVNDVSKTLRYAIPKQHLIPIGYVEGMMKVIENGNTQIEWNWEFDVEESKEAEAKEILTGVGTMGIQGIDALIKKSTAA